MSKKVITNNIDALAVKAGGVLEVFDGDEAIPAVQSIRKAAASLTDASFHINNTAQDVDGTAEKLAADEATLAETNAKLATDETSVSETAEKLVADEASISETAEKLATDETSVSETAEKLATDETTLSETNEKLAADEATLAETNTTLQTDESTLADAAAKLVTDEASVSETAEKLATDETSISDAAAKLVTDEASVSETAEKLATDETTLSEKVTELSTAISNVQAAVDGLDTESIQTAVDGVTSAAESVSTSAETFAKWAAIASDIYEGKAALVEALARQKFTCSVEDSLTTIGEMVKSLAKIYVATDYLSSSGVLVYTTSVENKKVTLTQYAQYFQSIIVDGEELQDGSVTGALTYTFAEAGNHEVTATLIDSPTTLYRCFYSCTALTYAGGTLFASCGMVTSLEQMFNGCSSLTSLDLSAFDTSSVTTMVMMFSGCSSLKEVYGLDLTCLETTTNMFYGCSAVYGFTATNIGKRSSLTSLPWSPLTYWGATDQYNVSFLETLVTTLTEGTYDRATAGFDACTIQLASAAGARLSDEEIETITSKGFTLSY